MILLKRRWAKVIENSLLLTASSLSSLTSLVAKHLLDHFLSLLTAHLLLALILHYYSSRTLYLTLFLSCATHTLPWVFSNSLQTTFTILLSDSLPAFGCLSLSTPWNEGPSYTTAKLSSFQIVFFFLYFLLHHFLSRPFFNELFANVDTFLRVASEWRE